MIKLIAAVGKNGELGKDNGLMWSLPGDMKFFRSTTSGSTVIMGRKTYESIGRPLPKRRNIVISRSPELKIDGAEVVYSLGDAIKLCEGDAYIIGGASVYKESFPFADEIILTEIDEGYDGADVFFPDFDKSLYKKETLAQGCDGETSYTHVKYSRIHNAQVDILPYTKDRIGDVAAFEKELRSQENFYFWDIGDSYISAVEKSFDDPRFNNSVSLLAYKDGVVVGRIDASLITTRFDGTISAYLDWICVLKSCRHEGVAQLLLAGLRSALKEMGVATLIALMANNDEAQKFYRSIDNAKIGDEGIRIEI